MFAMINCTCDGVAVPVKQRPMDGHFPIGLELDDQQPSSHGQQRHLSSLGPVHGDSAFPGELPILGLASVGPAPVQASPYDNFCPGGPCLHAPSLGQPMLSFDQMILRCSDMMEFLIQQQHQLQQALSTMAAAPFSAIHPKPTHKNLQQHDFEVMSRVMSNARSCPVPCQPAQYSEPHSCPPVCHSVSVPAVNAESTRWHTAAKACAISRKRTP